MRARIQVLIFQTLNLVLIAMVLYSPGIRKLYKSEINSTFVHCLTIYCFLSSLPQMGEIFFWKGL